MMMVAMGATVYFCFSIVWPTMVFSLYTSDLTYGGLLCTIIGLGTNAGEIRCGLDCRRLGRQKYQVIVAAICKGDGWVTPRLTRPKDHNIRHRRILPNTTLRAYRHKSVFLGHFAKKRALQLF
jgi:hypothetical protein